MTQPTFRYRAAETSTGGHWHAMARLCQVLVCLLLPPILWGSNFVIGRAVHGTIDPFSLNYYRWLIAFVVLAPMSWPALRGCWRSIVRRWRWVLTLSLLSVVSFNTLVYTALTMTTSAQGALLHAATPLVTMALALILLGDRFCGRQLAGCLLSFGGAVLVISNGVITFSLNHGEGIMLVTVAIWALFTVLLKIRPADVPALALLQSLILVGLVVQTPFFLAYGTSPHEILERSPEALIAALYLGVAASALAYWLWDKAIEIVGPTAASQFFHLVPLSAAIMAWSVLGESLSIRQWIGALLVLAGLMAAQGPAIMQRHWRARATGGGGKVRAARQGRLL
ncbi:MAG: EamA family transporter [Alphaproteobacteria bacterium]